MLIEVTDQCARNVRLPSLPQRIISLVPSQTELLYDLGLEDLIVGVTRFCVHPERALKEKRVVGGTKKIVQKRIKELQPDLIICNKEENTKEIVDFCETTAPTYISDISTLEESLEMILQIGKLTGTTQKAIELSNIINTEFKKLPNPTIKTRALYLIWKDPFMSVGNDTFIHDMLEKAGFDNVLKDQKRYPQLTIQEILDLRPEIIMFSSEPYSFNDLHIDEMLKAFNDNKTSNHALDHNGTNKSLKDNREVSSIAMPQCIIVDGEIFSWYGSRLLKTPDYLKNLLTITAS